jgi:transcription factor IIIB 90 kDa subunit
VQCGTIVEENAIVSTVEFQESGDRSHVIGQFVSANSSGKPYNNASRTRGRYGFTRDSRDTTLQNARRVIQQVSSSLRLPVHYVERAHRLYQLALQKNFLFGRRQIHVVATVLYTICRQEKSPHLLIDFSDMLQVNVYKLGQAFLQFVRLLNLKMPLIDPSLYIHRFASRLNLGEKQSHVSTTALRAVNRFKKDWIAIGRRPDGVCAAAMLIACRAHGFDHMQGEIAKLFRVSAETIRNRLDDFRTTPAAKMTLEEFHSTEFDEYEDNERAEEGGHDPPSYLRNIELKKS